MGIGTVERVDKDLPLRAAVAAAFERLRAADASHAALLFETRWLPTMELVEIVAEELAETDIEVLTLVHPSAAMSFIASAIAMRARLVTVEARRSLFDEPEDEHTDATASKTTFMMDPRESLERFVRRAVGEGRNRALRRFALIFDARSVPTMDLADILAEELLHSGVQEVGLIHPRASLDAVVAALRLRLPGVVVAFAAHRAG